MIINSKRLNFKPFTYDDYEDLHEILSNEKVCEFLPGEAAYDSEIITKWLNHFVRSFDDELGNKLFAIREEGSDKVIGYGGLSYVKEFESIEIMYGFNELFWNNGYATETSLRMKEFAIQLGLKNLIALADINNIPSNIILVKTGFKKIKQMKLWGLDVNYYEMKI